jgi:dienelactone hydrolase
MEALVKRTAFFASGAAAAALAISSPAAAEPQMKRWDEQKWALDDIIGSVGMDWDQGRSAAMIATMGPDSTNDVASLRNRIKKFADFVPAFESVGRRREALAKEAEAAGHAVSARDNYFMAANYYGHAQWSIYEKNDHNMALNAKKREMFGKYAQLADHHVEYVSLQTKAGKAIPGVFHLPPNYKAGTKIPAIVSVTGMDAYKERSVALYGDRWLNRGVAELALEAPGEWEAPLLDSFVSMENSIAAGPAVFDWLTGRPEVDTTKVGLTGVSFGTFFTTIMAANEPRFRAVANQGTIYEPGGKTIFGEASPTFKKRFMFMSGYTDEAKFDAFAKTLTLDGSYQKIKVPFLTMAGEADELSPLVNAERMYQAMTAPRRLVVYADSRHSLGGVPSVALGPTPGILATDWMLDTFAAKPMVSERWFVDPSGRVTISTYS